MTSHIRSAAGTVLLLLTAGYSPIEAQRHARDEERPAGGVVQYSLFERSGGSPDTTLIDFLYRIPGNQFVFLRDGSSGMFVARGEMLVEFRNDDGSRIGRDIIPIELRRSSQVSSQEVVEDYLGVVSFPLAADRYRLTVEIKDRESGQTSLDRSRRIDVGASPGKPSFLNHPLFVFRDSTTAAFVPFNRRGGVLYGSTGGVLVMMRCEPSEIPRELSWLIEPSGRFQSPSPSTYSGTETGAPLERLVPGADHRRILYNFAPPSSGATATTWYLHLPLEKLEPGEYTLHLSAKVGESKSELNSAFPIIWQNQPFSLNDFDLAVDALRYIAVEEDIDDMVGFMADNGRLRFKEFWRRKDPDTSTAYNEVQEEYYRRVDEAIRKFSTRGEFDGYKTDRGRILVLYGTPTRADRIFRPDTGPREVWVYERLRKRFVFIDPTRTGEYELSQTESL